MPDATWLEVSQAAEEFGVEVGQAVDAEVGI
jgi:uncharacterized protein YunC (DUF1805 family)